MVHRSDARRSRGDGGGKLLEHDEIAAAALVSMAGMDPIFFMRTKNAEAREIMTEIALASQELHKRELDYLAMQIAKKMSGE